MYAVQMFSLFYSLAMDTDWVALSTTFLAASRPTLSNMKAMY